MGRTSKFIRSAKSLVKSIKEGKGSPEFLGMFVPFSKGRCFKCDERLQIVDSKKTGSGTEYQFQCGHVIVITSLPEVTNGGSGYSNSRVGINEDGDHDIQIIRGGTSYHKTADEISVAKTFGHNFFPELDFFKNDIENSPVDVIAESKKNHIVEYFQITRLGDEKFWAELSRNNEVRRVLPEIAILVEKAILRKSKYDLQERKKIILLIDAKPGVMKEIADEVKDKLRASLESSGFKQIWIAGAIKQLTHKIY